LTVASVRRAHVAGLLLSAAIAMVCRPLQAAESPASLPLSVAQQTAIARAFAPTLVFHPLETYFPINSMHSLGTALPGVETWPSRVAGYRGLSRADKLGRAALGYRVFPRFARDRTEIVVEYWCYYVYNEFTVRGTWLPYRMPDNHPHDLERLYLVLTPAESADAAGGVIDETWARAAFRIRSVVANAHDGSIPPNQYEVAASKTIEAPLIVLVERGSHAMAPDINQDGRFTPGIDSTAARKLQWGIRDTGATGSRYRASFMDDRDASSMRLCGPATRREPAMDSCLRYSLYTVDDLQSWFQGLELSPLERETVLGRLPWWVRTFGDVRLESLWVPTDPPDGSVMDTMVQRRIRGQTGFLMGVTSAPDYPALVVGQRFYWNVGPRRMPDVAAEVVALFSASRPVLEGTLWGSYTVDAITNVVIGGGWFSGAQAADIAAGTDLRLGRFTLRPTWRVRGRMFNTRLTTTF